MKEIPTSRAAAGAAHLLSANGHDHDYRMRETPLFRGIYRSETTRAPWRDYAEPGAYFITICTKFRVPWFGSVRNGIMDLSDIGRTAHDCWTDIPAHFPGVVPDAYVVMPDHVHGIVVIGHRMGDVVATCDSHVATTHGSMRPTIPRPSPGSLGSIINQYKTACTKRIREIEPDFAWQSRFYDRIIRDPAAHAHIRAYIRNNPKNWQP